MARCRRGHADNQPNAVWHGRGSIKPEYRSLGITTDAAPLTAGRRDVKNAPADVRPLNRRCGMRGGSAGSNVRPAGDMLPTAPQRRDPRITMNPDDPDDCLRPPNDSAYETSEVRTGPPLAYVAEKVRHTLEALHSLIQELARCLPHAPHSSRASA